MSTRQRVERTLFGACALASAAVLVVLLVGLVASETRAEVWASVTLWVSAVATLVFTIAACRVDDDSTGEPGSLHVMVDGLRNEWRRDRAV